MYKIGIDLGGTNIAVGLVNEIMPVKKKHIYKSAEYYIYLKCLENKPIRIDVIEVYKFHH